MSYKRQAKSHYRPIRRTPQWNVRRLIDTPQLEAKVYSNQWNVRSHSDPSRSYTVSLTDVGEYECSCPQWIYRRKQCKHIQEVQERLRNPPFTKQTLKRAGIQMPKMPKPKQLKLPAS